MKMERPLTGADAASPDIGGACTTILAIGKAARDGETLSGQVEELFSMTPRFAVDILVNEKTGIKLIGPAEPRWICPALHYLNSCGVALQSNARSNKYPEQSDIQKSLYGREGMRILQEAHTAKEARDIAEEIARTGGCQPWLPGDSFGGGSRTFADKDEAYIVEGFGPGKYAVVGPKRDTAFAHANYVISPKLKRSEVTPVGIRRAKRAQELLDQRMETVASVACPTGAGSLTQAYFFRILRDHQYGFDQTYAYDDRGNISGWGYATTNQFAVVSAISVDYPDLLSTWWSTPNFAPFSPFIPFFIGINQVPPAFAVGKTNRTAIFHELVTAIGYNLSYADKIQQFWEAFEFQTLREMFYPWGGVVAEAKIAMKAGDRKKAEDLLYEFTSKKCELALTYAAELREKVKSDCLVELK